MAQAEQQNEIKFETPVRMEQVESVFRQINIRCGDRQVTQRVCRHITRAIQNKEVITRQKVRAFFIGCI